MAELSEELIIFLSIFGAACFVVIGYAFYRLGLFGKTGDLEETDFNQRNTEQDLYMAELREKYREGMFMEARYGRHQSRQQPISPA